MGKTLKLGVILLLVCAVSAGVLSSVYSVTSKIIGARKAEEQARSMQIVLPQATDFNALSPEEVARFTADPVRRDRRHLHRRRQRPGAGHRGPGAPRGLRRAHHHAGGHRRRHDGEGPPGDEPQRNTWPRLGDHKQVVAGAVHREGRLWAPGGEQGRRRDHRHFQRHHFLARGGARGERRA